jgi:hypothetical protein
MAFTKHRLLMKANETHDGERKHQYEVENGVSGFPRFYDMLFTMRVATGLTI